MNGIIILVVLVLTGTLTAFAIHRVTRPSTTIPPRRRELNRARNVAASAREALDEVGLVLDTYQNALDAQGDALVTHVRTILRNHDNRMRELDK